MVKLKNNHRISHAHRNIASLMAASANLKRWIIVLFLFYKLDYKDYYCYGISSGSAILNNENGKKIFLSPFVLFLLWQISLLPLPSKVNSLSAPAFVVLPGECFMMPRLLLFLFFHFRKRINRPDFNPINAKGLKSRGFSCLFYHCYDSIELTICDSWGDCGDCITLRQSV